MRDEYAELVEEMQVTVDIAKEEKRELSAEENTRVVTIETQLTKLDGDIKLKERMEARLNKKALADQTIEIRHKRKPETEDKKVLKRYSILNAINVRMVIPTQKVVFTHDPS